MVYKLFDKKSASLDKSKGSGIINEPNYQLVIRKFIHHLEIIFAVLI